MVGVVGRAWWVGAVVVVAVRLSRPSDAILFLLACCIRQRPTATASTSTSTSTSHPQLYHRGAWPLVVGAARVE